MYTVLKFKHLYRSDYYYSRLIIFHRNQKSIYLDLFMQVILLLLYNVVTVLFNRKE